MKLKSALIKLFTLLLLFCLTILTLSACADTSDNRTTIRVAYLPITHSAALMMMKAHADPAASYQIELVRFSTWPDVVDALRTGRVDGASILFEVALAARNADDSLFMVSLSHRDGNVVVVQNDIYCYSELIGQVVAIPHRLSPHNTLFNMVLERENISADDVQIIEISPAEMPASMASGAIAAYVVAEPFGAIAQDAGIGRIFETSEEICRHNVCCVLIFREEVLSQSLKEWLLPGFELAAENTHKRDNTVLEVFMGHSPLSPEVIEQALANTSFENLFLTEEEYELITEIILRHGILEQVPSFDSFVLDISN